MNIYKIESWAVGYTKYPWVSGWSPLEHMPFFDDSPPLFKEMKRKSWKINPRPSGLYIDPGGRVWSDVLGCGGGPPDYFVSERILNDLTNEGIPVFRATEMPIAENLSKALKNTPPPKYYVLEAAPGISHDYDKMGLKLGSDGYPIFEPGVKHPEKICRISSWTGNDLFCFQDTRCNWSLNVMCTDRVKNLAERKDWTNIEFKPVKAV